MRLHTLPPAHSPARRRRLVLGLEEARQIAQRQGKGELRRGHDKVKEDVVPCHASRKAECPRRDDQITCHFGTAVGKAQVSSAEKGEGHCDAEEDDDKDDVGPEGRNRQEEDVDAPEDEVKRKRRIQIRGIARIARLDHVNRVDKDGETEPECAKGKKDDERERVADDELEDSCDDHADGSHGVVSAQQTQLSGSRQASEAHQDAGCGAQVQDEADDAQRRGIAESFDELTLRARLHGGLQVHFCKREDPNKTNVVSLSPPRLGLTRVLTYLRTAEASR